MKIMRLALVALFAVLAFSTMAAASASAFHPLFLTESGKELLFIGEGGLGTLAGGLPTLRALNLGNLGTITCEKVLVHGFVLDKSTLAHRIKILFHSKCEQNVNGSRSTCEEPIHIKELLAELGLVLPGTLTVGILLIPSDGTTEFTTTKCGGLNTTVLGAVIGEIPEISADTHLNQYNKLLTLSEQVFEAAHQTDDTQNITSIELLGVSMPGELKVEGFFGGKASEEARAILHSDGKVLICTSAPQNCE